MEDHEEPSPEDIERFSDVTRDCPHCGKEISDDAEKCHFCGEWVDARTAKSLPAWAVVAGVAAIAALLVAFVLRGGIF